MEGYINENRWIDLSGLPHFKGKCHFINWKECAGYKVPFKYYNVSGEICILDCKQHPRYSKTMLTIYIDKYTVQPIEVDTGFMVHCRLTYLVENRIADVKPELVSYLKNKQDAFLYAINSEKEIDVVCPVCGYER